MVLPRAALVGLLVLVALLAVTANATTLNLEMFLASNSSRAVCNDGSPAGFYSRLNPKSTRWVVHLQGGFWCYDEATCLRRKNSPNMYSSKGWKKQINAEGIFSSQADVNPDFYEANLIYVPYCTSDAWAGSGQYKFSNNEVYQFRGKAVLAKLFEQLTRKYNFKSAKAVVLSGCSAGGQGVVNNVDYVGQFIPAGVRYMGLADAGWMMDVRHSLTKNVPVYKQFESGHRIWSGQPNQACAHANPNNVHLCYFSPKAVEYIRSYVFFQTELYDTFQTGWSCCGNPPYTAEQTAWLESYRANVTESFKAIHGRFSVWSAACHSHCFSESRAWSTANIDGVTMQKAFSQSFVKVVPTKNVAKCRGMQCTGNCPEKKQLASDVFE